MKVIYYLLAMFLTAVVVLALATAIVLRFNWVYIMIGIVAIQLVNLGSIIYKILKHLI